MEVSQLSAVMAPSVVREHSGCGQASTANASLEYLGESGERRWSSPLFTSNASNVSTHMFSMNMDLLETNGQWNLNYQKRVVDSAQWVNETVPTDNVE